MRRLLAHLCFFAIAVNLAAAQDVVETRDPDGVIRKADLWLWPVIQPLYATGLLPMPKEDRETPVFSRKEMTLSILLATDLAVLDLSASRGWRHDRRGPGTRESRARLWAHYYSNIDFLLTEFTPEIRALGVDRWALDYQQDRLLSLFGKNEIGLPRSQFGPFRDVPPNHWAAKAVGQLRKLGILNGYPDSRFRG